MLSLNDISDSLQIKLFGRKPTRSEPDLSITKYELTISLSIYIIFKYKQQLHKHACIYSA